MRWVFAALLALLAFWTWRPYIREIPSAAVALTQRALTALERPANSIGHITVGFLNAAGWTIPLDWAPAIGWAVLASFIGSFLTSRAFRIMLTVIVLALGAMAVLNYFAQGSPG